MPYTYALSSVIPATPQEIYDAWLDSIAHSQMTGGDANVSDQVGAEFSAWGDYITGRNLELVPGERIVQSWRTTKFDDEHEDSIITVTLEEADDGTLLTLVHSNVPDEHTNYEDGGWQSNYFEPMKAYFAGLPREAGESEPPPAAPRSADTASAPRRRVRRAAGKKAGKARPKVASAKAIKKKKRSKRAAAAKTKRKGARKAANPRAKKAAKRASPKRKSGPRKRARR